MPKLSNAFDRQSLRQALQSWDRTEELGQHALADLQIVESRRKMAAYQLSKTGYGLALRDVLRAAIGQLRPSEGDEKPYAKAWRHNLILSKRYIDGRSPDYLAEQLGIARSTYNAEQAGALDRLSSILAQWEHGGSFPGTWRLPRLETSDGVLPTINAPQLPPTGLVGRKTLLDDLRQMLIAGQDVVLLGPPGIGKSAIASALAHNEELRRHFRDGVLWTGLGKRAKGLMKTTKWAVQLGLPLNELSDLEDIEARERVINNALAARTLLLVMDDVCDAQDALALKIRGPKSVHLYTTRSPSVARQLAKDRAVEIGGLTQAEGVSLLQHFVPNIDDTSAYPLVQSVHGIPLTLVIVGKFLRNENQAGQGQPSEEALHRLHGVPPTDPGPPQKPDLDANGHLSIEKVLQFSMETLEPHMRELLSALTLFPPKPNTFSAQAATAVAGVSAQSLEILIDRGLLESGGQDRFTLQRTIRKHIPRGEGIAQAAERFLHYFLDFVEVNQDNHDLIEKEVRNIIAALDSAHGLGEQGDLIRGSNALFAHLELLGLLDGAGEILNRAEMAARSREDWLGTLANLGRVAHRREKYDQAEACYAQGLEIAKEHKDIGAECAMLRGLGVVAFRRGDYDAAHTYFQQGLRLARKKAAAHHVFDLNANMGALYLAQRDLRGAQKHFTRALKWARKGEDSARVRSILTHLGDLALAKKKYEQAGDYYTVSLGIARAAADEKWIADLSLKLGTLANEQGKDRKAGDYFRDALAIEKKLGNNAQVALLQGNLGALATRRGDFYTAKILIDAGLRLARSIGHDQHTIQLLINLAELHAQQRARAEARSTLEEALSLAEEIDHQRLVDSIQEKLDDLR
ncbi:MAG: tetratricopeptide repeat protein [Chloroflexi bacterium]|nr:tetratricopeptide repeat protein [Chloroflexota bacterium]